ncbi:MAG: hypothetical protein HY291_14555 [Planctomycetes bacterium]|nr:hypothetical protein [Planctomycetota bacterium]
MSPPPSSTPSLAAVVRVLKDGIWDRCELIQLASGELRVRKTTKGTGPWGVNTLRAETHYLQALPPGAAEHFPAVLAAWGEKPEESNVGYEMPYFDGWRDGGEWVRSGTLYQKDADRLQEDLAQTVFRSLHRPEPARPALAAHVEEIIRGALEQLDRLPEFSELMRAGEIVLNGHALPGPERAFQALLAQGDLFRALAQAPCVLLHGDLLLENVLWRTNILAGKPRLILLDPVSVAGVALGPPIFDLVKYESYATGELYAMRTGLVEAARANDPGATPAYRYRVRWEDSAMRPFRLVDLHTRFRAAYTARHGEFDRNVYRLLDAYFALVMALNTTGLLRWARVLKATECLGEIAKH